MENGKKLKLRILNDKVKTAEAIRELAIKLEDCDSHIRATLMESLAILGKLMDDYDNIVEKIDASNLTEDK